VTDQPRKKLIEVALPLDEINAACKADKDRKSGTIRNLHKWFAPMPLPAWRALIFAALVDDPGDDEHRAYLLDVIKRLVANGADLPDDIAVDEARRIIATQFPGGVPQVFDPFCGGGSTLVEAQRLGLPTFGSDLNPVPALITRTLTELLPKVHGRTALSSTATAGAGGPGSVEAELSLIPAISRVAGFEGLQGLVQDVIAYAERVQRRVDEALKPYFHREPQERPIAWVWARTATCTNPACGAETVLTTSWWLSKKPGALAWVEPRLRGREITLAVVESRIGSAPKPPKEGRGAAFACIVCHQVINSGDISAQGAAGGLGLRMLAVATEVKGRRRYRAPSAADVAAATLAERPDRAPDDVPVGDGGSRDRFGLMTQADLYTDRQLLTLCTFADQIAAIHEEVLSDGGDQTWASAVTTLLALGLGGLAMASSSQSRWRERNVESKAEPAFGRNDLPMTWDFAETYYASESVGDWMSIIRRAAVTAAKWSVPGQGTVARADARTSHPGRVGLVATDPPYFDAIGYADLSDYFYVWHRRALRAVHPDLYATVAAPKTGELTALSVHHGNSREAARAYFIAGFTETFRNLQCSLAADLPMLVVYASKEQSGGGDEQTRWSSILTAMVQAELQIVGTWPIHGTGSSRMIGQGTNSVATYVVMICRPRSAAAGSCSLGDFNRALRRELRPAVHDFQSAGILPVDLGQAAVAGRVR
jgi:putative DNA methylase